MPHGKITAVIPASAAEVFELLHDYSQRLKWDTLLSDARLSGEAQFAAAGVESVCTGRWYLGGIPMATRYVTFKPGKVAAVKLTNRPAFFETFAASIRHADLPGGGSSIEYAWNFTARPACLQFVLHPLMQSIFRIETGKRLAALATWFQKR